MDTKEQLTAAAVETIQRSGVHGVTFRNLGAQVGIKSASVHYHFGSKDGLLSTVTAHYTDTFLAHLAALEGSPVARLLGLLALFDVALADGRGCLCAAMAIHPDQLDDTTRQQLRAYFDAVEDWAAGPLRELGQPAAAGMLVSAMEGALLIDRLDQGRDRLGQLRRWILSLGGSRA